MRALTLDEVQVVSGGLSKEEAGVISGVFAAGAALTGSFALVPGPHTPVAGFISGAMAFGSACLDFMQLVEVLSALLFK